MLGKRCVKVGDFERVFTRIALIGIKDVSLCDIEASLIDEKTKPGAITAIFAIFCGVDFVACDRKKRVRKTCDFQVGTNDFKRLKLRLPKKTSPIKGGVDTRQCERLFGPGLFYRDVF